MLYLIESSNIVREFEQSRSKMFVEIPNNKFNGIMVTHNQTLHNPPIFYLYYSNWNQKSKTTYKVLL